MSGNIVEILTCPTGGAPLQAVQEADLVAGEGIAGDRYCNGSGTFSRKLAGKPDREVTLIESEEIEGFNARALLAYPSSAFRRNVVTAGVRLNALVGKEFMLGDTRLRGIRLCEPCAHLATLLGQEVLQHMVHRAGLRAAVVQGGTIRPGDPVAI